MTEGIIHQVFENWISCRPHITKTGMDELYSIEQELIEEIRKNLFCIFDVETLNDVSIEYGYDLTFKAEQIRNLLIGDTKE